MKKYIGVWILCAVLPLAVQAQKPKEVGQEAGKRGRAALDKVGQVNFSWWNPEIGLGRIEHLDSGYCQRLLRLFGDDTDEPRG